MSSDSWTRSVTSYDAPENFGREFRIDDFRRRSGSALLGEKIPGRAVVYVFAPSARCT